MEERYVACMLLHALGDTIGFNNSKWEFMPGDAQKVWEKVNQFVALGGVNYVPPKGWIISDDTIMHMKTAMSLLEDFKSINSFGKILKENYIDAYDQFIKEGPNVRYPGRTLMTNIEKLKKGLEWDQMDYDFNYGGSGASMRTSCIGLAYHNPNDFENLMRVSIESSRMTHNSATGYLGGFTSALFTSYAIQGIDIKKWPYKLIELFDNQTINMYIRNAGRDVGNYFEDFHVFIKKWKKYVDIKFNDQGEPIEQKASKDLRYRTEFYHKMFGNQLDPDTFFPGSGGDDSTIISYDCLLDAGRNWEKLVFYAMLNGGDADTTGCIAGSWYGALYGFADVPKNIPDNIEMKDEIISLGKQLYDKFGKLEK
jgi:ADP-ribosylarginine hydrolase